MRQRFYPGTEVWLASDSSSSSYSGVFEDDGEAAYFYAYDRDERAVARVICSFVGLAVMPANHSLKRTAAMGIRAIMRAAAAAAQPRRQG